MSGAARPSAGGVGPQPLVAVVEQISFQLCTARSNGWIDDITYRREMEGLRRSSFAAMGVKEPAVGMPAAPTSNDDPNRVQPQALAASVPDPP